MDETQKKKTVESPAFEYVIKRISNAFQYRTSQEWNKFREYWRTEEAKKAVLNFLTDENFE